MKPLNNILITLVVLVVVMYVAVFDGAVYSSSYTADSVRYMRMAENIKAGHLMNPDGIAGGEGWFAIWPIGYPVVVAATSAVTGLDGFWASKVISILCAFVMLIIFWRRGKDAFPLLAFSIVNLAYLKITRSTLSEPLFMVLLVAIGFVVEGIVTTTKEGGIDWRRATALWGLFVAVFLVRYVGFFVPAWVVVAVLLCRVERGALGTVAAAVVGAWIFDVSYWMMNKVMCGYVSGYGRALPKETGMELIRMVASAELHELQAYVILAILVACLWFVGSRSIPRREIDRHDLFAAHKGWIGFVIIGVQYHAALVFMRCRQSFDVLGFRLLYPGTLMIVIGLVLLLTQTISRFRVWSCVEFVNAIPLRRFGSFLLVVVLFGCWLLHGELQLRSALGINVYSLGRPYPELRKQLLEKYANVPSGTKLNIGCSCCDEDFMIAALRPDLIIETVENWDNR